ncbi:methyltransferase domain-containing protein [Parvibaculum sp.]|uniref:class I SAM-dependent methyltransferase n=1 Tax=Parvibaculum sp. TaxID=2024848 RepID=UPI003BAA93AD
MIKRTLKKIRGRVRRSLATGEERIVVSSPAVLRPSPADVLFEDRDGRVHIVDDSLRYRMKETWRLFSPLSLLAELKERGLLDVSGVELLDRLKGSRTVTASLEEMTDLVRPYAEKHENLLLGGSLGGIGKRVLRPEREEVETRIEEGVLHHKALLEELSALGVTVPAGASIMEIGFISGGESIVAFERLGFKGAGIDYFYDGAFDSNHRYKEVQRLTGTKVRFVPGDLTQRTSFGDEEFNFIYSHQVLEHIRDLEAAFSEMSRILKPGGVMFHHYDPYFHPMGGHSFGTLDFPWGHVRLDEDDFARYIETLRPFEAPHALPWCAGSLNRINTIQRVQRKLVEAGFAIKLFKTTTTRFLKDMPLDRHVVRDCLERNPHLSLADLLTSKIVVVAQKT